MKIFDFGSGHRKAIAKALTAFGDPPKKFSPKPPQNDLNAEDLHRLAAPRAKVTMKAGDVAAMPADIRHKGYSAKRSMLIVWENNDDRLPAMYGKGELKPYPVEF